MTLLDQNAKQRERAHSKNARTKLHNVSDRISWKWKNTCITSSRKDINWRTQNPAQESILRDVERDVVLHWRQDLHKSCSWNRHFRRILRVPQAESEPVLLSP